MMTILTNPNSEKRPAPTVPLVEDDTAVFVPECASNENSTRKWKSLWRLLSVTGATLCILILSLAVGIACGRLYKHYLLAQVDYCPRYKSFGCSANFPYNSESHIIQPEPGIHQRADGNFQTFREDFELDIETRRYLMITVRYTNQRVSTFIHDFDANMSAIADLNGGRCYLLPLDSHHVKTPTQMFNMIHQSLHGCNRANYEVVKLTMHAAVPPIQFRRGISCYVTEYCRSHPIYKLKIVERNSSNVVDGIPEEATFAEFAGNGIMYYEIENYGQLKRYEDIMASQ